MSLVVRDRRLDAFLTVGCPLNKLYLLYIYIHIRMCMALFVYMGT